VRCGCTRCLLRAALELLRSGRAGMAALLIEQALETEQAKAEKPKPLVRPVPSSRKRRSRRA
jgi:hypothetical protein